MEAAKQTDEDQFQSLGADVKDKHFNKIFSNSIRLSLKTEFGFTISRLQFVRKMKKVKRIELFQCSQQWQVKLLLLRPPLKKEFFHIRVPCTPSDIRKCAFLCLFFVIHLPFRAMETMWIQCGNYYKMS